MSLCITKNSNFQSHKPATYSVIKHKLPHQNVQYKENKTYQHFLNKTITCSKVTLLTVMRKKHPTFTIGHIAHNHKYKHNL